MMNLILKVIIEHYGSSADSLFIKPIAIENQSMKFQSSGNY